MQIDLKIPSHNTRLINFDVILRDSICLFKEDCIKYALSFDPTIDSNVCRLLQNSIIITLCDRIKAISLIEKKVIYINTSSNFLPANQQEFILDMVKNILDNMAIPFILHVEDYNTFISKLIERNNDSLYLFNEAYNKFSKRNNTSSNYKKLMSFLKSSGLIFLQSYFKGSTNKLIVLS